MLCGGFWIGRSYMMDFGEVGLEGLMVPENGVSSSHAVSTTKPESNGSGILKRGRSGSGEEEWRSSGVARTDDSDSAKTMLFHQQGAHSLLLRSNSHLSGDDDQHHTMLSFSSPRSEVPFLSKTAGLAERSTQNPVFSYYQHSPYAYSRNAGYGSGGLNAGLHPSLLGGRGPFTPSQWVELEHQALIYKHIMANVPIPSNLLITLKRPLIPYGLSSGSNVPNSVGWGSFHLGYSGNTDPEPGRCRRTDGKKWRCSRDAVPDQKYCERHINRGRHRSRKPVEGRTGQAVPGATTNVAPITCSPSASVMSSSGASSNFSIMQHQFKGLQPGAENPSADVVNNRLQDHGGLSVVSATASLKSKDSPFSVPKQHIRLEDSSEFGLVSSAPLLNPSEKSSYMNSTNFNLDFNDHESHDQRPLHHFTNDWPKDQSNRTTSVAWHEELKSDWTQLSMSIPMASDFSSTSSPSPKEKTALSPFRISCELGPMEMGLAVNNDLSGSTQKQPNWIPISWGSSMGGPLGEALNSSKNSSALNLTTGAWTGSPQLGSSPTGVLQMTTFVSLSNSSSTSNSTVDNKKTDEGGSLGDDMLGSTIARSFSIPSL